jgi:hypothetical protein
MGELSIGLVGFGLEGCFCIEWSLWFADLSEEEEEEEEEE